ncbi:response regulator transcription factor [Ideonella sp. DXS29W]|uniref:Response regulator transcription factor n=1 Tax=Ideonella lacteola TaxID=2984193 RepID=A0ABU9BWW4_9BURK
MKIRVVIADDHHCVREGIVALLERETDIEVVAQARDGMELVRLAREWQPDVVLVDLCMPCMNGIEAIRRLRSEPLACKAICLSMQSDPHQVQAALDAGASGFVLKENSFDELARGIRRVHAGQLFLSGELVGQVLAHGGAAPAAHPTAQRLTPRERQMVQLLAEGYSTQQIADQLHLSAKTVATHREHVFAKLQIQGIAQLTRFALRAGISSLDARGP